MNSDKDPTLVEENEESLLWEYLEEGEYDYKRPRRGEIRDGTILRKEEDHIIVDIGAKREGIVPTSDLEKLGPEAVAKLEVGEQVPVYVLKPESQDGDIIVSINLAQQMADWEGAEKLMQADEILEKKIIGYNKGGLLVEVGHLQGFIPRSHIVDLGGRTKSGTPQERLSQMIGRELPLKIIEVNRRQRRLILSERAAWREWRAEQKRRLLEDLEVGDVRKGTVTSLADFGAFVDLGGADGLIHVSELSWDRGKKPGDVLKVGDEVEVKIISLDRERKRIGLSLKQLKPNPWETIEERYAIGQYVDVEVTNLAKFGAFARLEEGIEGLIHISELAEHNVQHPREVIKAGQALTVQILSVDPQRKRVGLSLRRVPEHLRMPVETEEEGSEELEELWEPEGAEAKSTDLAEAVVEQAEPAGDAEVEQEAVTEASGEAIAESDEAAAEETELVSETDRLDAEPSVSVTEAAVSAAGPASEPAEAEPAEEALAQPFDPATDPSSSSGEASGHREAQDKVQEATPTATSVNGNNVAEEEAEIASAVELSHEASTELGS
ncbi:MAG: 30S ribosomal protein S1 [Anaerolineae bacterium]